MKHTRPSRIVVVDDELVFVEAIALAISLTPDLDVVGRATSAAEAVEMSLAADPDLLICDYRLGGGETGIDVARRLRHAGARMPIAVLTAFGGDVVRREAATVRNVSVIPKQQGVTDLVTACRRVLAGMVPSATFDPDDSLLSSGELDVLDAISHGASAKTIAADLDVSIHTVRARIKRILQKLDVGSQVEAVAEAMRRGIVVPPG